MKSLVHQSATLSSTQHHKPILVDTTYMPGPSTKPIVIFCHGYKGFKDWGAWPLVANAFAEAGFFFVKFNFSHNGGTIAQPIDFPDLEAFGQNTYLKEVEDTHEVLRWIHGLENASDCMLNRNQITVIGHSRGGGIASIVASETDTIHQLVSWAGLADYASRFPKGDAFAQWKKDGVYFVTNGRTQQQMPHYFQFYTSFLAHEERLNIQNAISQIRIPHLIIHGTADTSVSPQHAKDMHAWNPKSTLLLIPDANHVFGATHPWHHTVLPNHLATVVQETINYIQS